MPMPTVTKMPLDYRLQTGEDGEPAVLAAFDLFIDDFFHGLDEIIGDSYFGPVYEDHIEKYNYAKGWDSVLAEMVSIADGIPNREKSELLYLLLVEPFSMLFENEWREK